MKRYFVAAGVLLLASPAMLFAADAKITINEIAWMGTTTSASDEWLELHNPTDSLISLAGWKLQSADGKIQISLKGSVKSQEYYLIERTNNESVPNIPADIIYKGALNNAGGHLFLYNAKNILIDEVNFTSHWPAGNTTTKQTMEKTATGWQTSTSPNGTPKSANSAGMVKNKPAAALLKNEKSGNSDNVSAATAALSPQIPSGKSNPWILFLAALIIAIILGIFAVIIKLKILHHKS